MPKLSLPAKAQFELPEDVIYLDGNSLGALPKGSVEKATRTIQSEWGQQLIRAWNTAGWMDLPRQIGNKIAPLIGAAEGTVATGDTLSIKVFQALDAAIKMRPGRTKILSDTGNFPTDLYMAQGLLRSLDRGLELITVAPEAVEEAIDDDTAAVFLTEVDYRSGRRHDMMQITKTAHTHGAVMIWDLAHSAGAIPVHMTASNAEFAVGCTYKYLNGGPGAPAFIYARPDIAGQIDPMMSGWLGHDAPFEFEPDYRPALSTERLRIGTPAILQFAVLDHALEVWTQTSIDEVWENAIELSNLFIERVEDSCPDLTLATPRDPELRGSHVSFHFEQGYAAMQALIARGVIGDFRAPDIMRFGITPLYLGPEDIEAAADHIATVINDRLWDDPTFKTKNRVT